MAAVAAVSCGTAKKTADATPVEKEPVSTVTPKVLPATGDVMKKPDVSLEQLNFSMEFLIGKLLSNNLIN